MIVLSPDHRRGRPFFLRCFEGKKKSSAPPLGFSFGIALCAVRLSFLFLRCTSRDDRMSKEISLSKKKRNLGVVVFLDLRFFDGVAPYGCLGAFCFVFCFLGKKN